MDTNYPLYLIFYIDSETMKISGIIQPFIESVNKVLHEKNANTIAFFLPTNDEERVECINPKVISETDMAPIHKIIQDITKSFSIGGNTDEDVPKDCKCGRNPDGTCKC